MAESNITLTLTDGEDILKSIKQCVKENGVEYAIPIEASGSIRDFEIVQTNQGANIDKFAPNNVCRITAISGKIQKQKGNNYYENIKISFTHTGFGSASGQLISGKAATGLEIKLRAVNLKNIIEA